MENKTEKELLICVVEKVDQLKDQYHRHELENQQQHDEMNADLKEHMRRSETNEAQLEILKNEIKPVLDSFHGLKIMFAMLSFMVGLLGIAIKFIH